MPAVGLLTNRTKCTTSKIKLKSQKKNIYINIFECKSRSNVFVGKLVSLDKG